VASFFGRATNSSRDQINALRQRQSCRKNLVVIGELLGVPYDDRADFQERSGRQLDLFLPIAASSARPARCAKRPRSGAE
jgi:hypothetical protein